MITLKISGERHKFPTTWPDVTYEQYVYHIIPRSLTESIHCYTGIPLKVLSEARITNLEKISLALVFMSLPPNMDRTAVVGRYIMPGDPKLESLAQFEDIRTMSKKYPQKGRSEWDFTDYEMEAEIYLTCCAIYCQKIRDGYYDNNKVESVKDELRGESAVAILSNGAFFLAKSLNMSTLSRGRFQRIIQRLRRALQVFPGYQRTLDFLQRSHKQR